MFDLVRIASRPSAATRLDLDGWQSPGARIPAGFSVEMQDIPSGLKCAALYAMLILSIGVVVAANVYLAVTVAGHHG